MFGSYLWLGDKSSEFSKEQYVIILVAPYLHFTLGGLYFSLVILLGW